jgi:hypothetical protein
MIKRILLCGRLALRGAEAPLFHGAASIPYQFKGDGQECPSYHGVPVLGILPK